LPLLVASLPVVGRLTTAIGKMPFCTPLAGSTIGRGWKNLIAPVGRLIAVVGRLTNNSTTGAAFSSLRPKNGFIYQTNTRTKP